MKHTVAEFAAKRKVQPGTIYNAIRNGSIIAEQVGNTKMIDDQLPENSRYLHKVRKTHYSPNTLLKNNTDTRRQKTFAEYLSYCEECSAMDEKPETFDDWHAEKQINKSNVIDIDSPDFGRQVAMMEFEKIKTSIELAKNRSKLLAVQRAEKMDLVVDVKTIQQKMQELASVFSVDMFSSVAKTVPRIIDIVKNSENPQLDLTVFLKKQYTEIVQKVKRITNETHNSEQVIEYKLYND